MSEFPTDLLQFLLDLEALQSTIASHDARSKDVPAPPTTSALPTIPPPNPKPQKRCGSCKHKLLLSDMACRCGIRHCSSHRLPETHDCSYDHKRAEKKVLEAQVVACVADKLGDRV